MKKTIFIHIPKTGGTSINAAMQDSNWQTEPNFYYRHIRLKDKKSNAGDIFMAKNVEKYQQYNIFMMLRHPVDRCISEYYFIRERKNFIDLLKKKPTSFESYIKNRQTQNGVVNFLRGRRFYDTNPVNENDLDAVLNAIDDIPVHVGIFEYFGQSLDYFTQVSQLDLKKDIEVKRMTFKRPSMQDISPEIRALILEKNALDWELYQYCLEKFEGIKNQYNAAAFRFEKDKYNHVIPYAAQCCFFECSMQNKQYLQQNLVFFRDLTFYLLKDRKIKSGSVFTQLWNSSYAAAVEAHFPGSTFAEYLQGQLATTKDPLEQSFAIAESVDRFLKQNKQNQSQWMQGMEFNPAFVSPTPTQENSPENKSKKGFLSRLFGKK